MITYVSFLRGINVSGQNKIKMDDLKNLFESLNFKNVRTYIQSGNVVFEDESIDCDILARLIEEKIQKDLGLVVSVIMRNQQQLKIILQNNPFLKNENKEVSALYVTFLAALPNDRIIEKISEKDTVPDEFRLMGQEIYLFCPDGYGRTKLNNSFFERKLKLKTTTRNWRTLNELNAMVNSIGID